MEKYIDLIPENKYRNQKKNVYLKRNIKKITDNIFKNNLPTKQDLAQDQFLTWDVPNP